MISKQFLLPAFYLFFLVGLPDRIEAQALAVPMLVEVEQVRKGNPLAAYVSLIKLEQQYLHSDFAEIYPQVRLMAEGFLGVPDAGLRAMNTIDQLKRQFKPGEAPIPSGYAAQSALRVIERAAARTQIVIFGEEHHLPQTRSLYEPILRSLWNLGYRYLAAETFSDSVMLSGFRGPTYTSGVYLRDPVFATAIRTAIDMGYRLVAYEETARGPDGDDSFRDRRQAENIQARIFAKDPAAKVLVLAGRGHASESTAPDGWTPMASVLKRITRIDPFTVFAVRMGERLTHEEEDPQYRYATSRGLVREPTIFVDTASARTLGDDSFDAFIFWPRTVITKGRPDWLVRELGRRPVELPANLTKGSGLRLVQAFRPGDPDTSIPVDQVLLDAAHISSVLMLPPGSFRLRTIDPAGTVVAEALTTVK